MVEIDAKNTTRNKRNFKIRKRGCMPNLQGASPIYRDDGGNSYEAWMIDRGRLGRATSWEGRNPQSRVGRQ